MAIQNPSVQLFASQPTGDVADVGRVVGDVVVQYCSYSRRLDRHCVVDADVGGDGVVGVWWHDLA